VEFAHTVLKKSRIAALEQVFDLRSPMEQSACRGAAKPKMAKEFCATRSESYASTRRHVKTRVAIRIGEVNISGNKNVLIIRIPRRQNQRAKNRYFN
jgi:hypothetical protein